MRIRINGETFIATSMFLIIIYLCIPIAMTYLNSLLIHAIVIVSSGAFIVGMVLLNRWKYLIVFLGLFVFTLLFWSITWREQLNTITYFYYCFASLTFAFGSIILYSSENDAMLRRLFLFLTAIYFITSITTISGLNIYPLAARELARGSTYDTSLDFTVRKNIYRSMNIASWSQIYGMLFAIPTSLFVWKRKKNVFYLVLCISLGLMIVASQITFAVLLALVLILGLVIFRESSTKTIIISMLILAVAMLVILNPERILSFTVSISEDAGLDFLSTKLNDLWTLLLYRNAVGNVGARSELYTRSLETFLNSPVVGLLFGGKGDLSTIGYHSDFFDMLGTFGLIGLIVMCASLTGYIRFLKRMKAETRKELIIIFLGFILLFILDPIFNSPQVFAGAFLYPVLGSKYCLMEDTERKSAFRFAANRSLR